MSTSCFFEACSTCNLVYDALLRGAVWAERRAVNLVHCAFHLSDDGKVCCC